MEDYSHDELEAPEWLNQEFLKEVLKSVEKTEKIKIKKYEVAPAVTKGNHFASIMFRVNIDYCICNDNNQNEINKNESLIIKAKPDKDGPKKDLLEQCEIFETEIQMFAKTLPYFEKVFKDNGINIRFGAKMLYNVRNKVIVLDDLKKLGYSLYSDNWIMFDDYKLVLNRLAKWHAVSYKIFQEDDPQLVQYYIHRGIMTAIDVNSNVTFTSGTKLFYDVLSSMSDIDKIYVEQYANVKDIILKESIRVHSDTNGKFNVLNHGDFHLRNMLFKQGDNGKIADVLFVDFQMSVWGSPAIDIIYSLYMLADPEIRQNRRDEVIYFYYTSFVDTLKELKFSKSIPTYEDLQAEINKNKKFELFISASFLPYLHQMASGVKFDENDLNDDGEKKKKIYMSSEYLNDMKKMMPYYLHNGYFLNYND